MSELPAVPEINLNSLVEKPGGLEEALFGLIEMKVKYLNKLPEKEKIEKQIDDISSKIAELEEERKKNSISPKKTSHGEEAGNNSLSMGSDSGIKPENLDGLSINRGEILKIVTKGLENGTITSSEDKLELSTDLFGKTLCFKEKGEFESVKKAVDGIYDNLKEMGLDVRKFEKSKGEESASFYAIRFPEAYKGERDVTKMTNAEIIQIKSDYKNETPEKKQSVDLNNYGFRALGHKDLIVDKVSIFNNLSLKKAEEQTVQADNPVEQENTHVAQLQRRGSFIKDKGDYGR
jgi:hypothetical protein